MNEGTGMHAMLDDVAVYALGTLPPAEAERVRAHIATCELCREEYQALRETAALVGMSAETTGNAESCPSTLLKPRIMRQVRAGAGAPPTREPVPSRRPPLVWPAYLVAAAAVVLAIMASMWNVALTGQLRQTQQQLARVSESSSRLAQRHAELVAEMSDILRADAKHFASGRDEIVTRGSRLYVAMRDLPEPPHGKVYQAWTLAKGAKGVEPSVTFVPDAHGVALVLLPADARSIAAVAVSVEPEGGSKQPTTKPILLVPLT